METLKAAQRTVSTTMDRDTANGLRAAREIAEELALDGYFGPLYELFEVDDRYKTAVEVTAGTRSAFSRNQRPDLVLTVLTFCSPASRLNSLFQIVVDTDDTATKILDRMVRDKSGRVTFMPLNRLRVYDVEYPKTNEAIPMQVSNGVFPCSLNCTDFLPPPPFQDQQAQVQRAVPPGIQAGVRPDSRLSDARDCRCLHAFARTQRDHA